MPHAARRCHRADGRGVGDDLLARQNGAAGSDARLYRSVVEIDNEALIAAFASRVDAATAEMLASASDATFADLPTVNVTLLATVFGTVRNVFERNLPPNEERAVQGQLLMMCNAYLEAARSPH